MFDRQFDGDVSSVKKFFEFFGGVCKHGVVTFEVEVFQVIGAFFEFYFPGVDAFSSNLYKMSVTSR